MQIESYKTTENEEDFSHILPTIGLYSSMKADLAKAMSITFGVFVVVGVIANMYLWSKADRSNRFEAKFIKEREHPVSCLLLGECWDWDCNSSQDRRENAERLLSDYITLIFKPNNENAVKSLTSATIDNRVNPKRGKVCARRLLGLCLYLGLLVVSLHLVALVL